MEGQRRAGGRVFMIKESQRYVLVEAFKPKLPPLPQEHTKNLRTGINLLKQGILPTTVFAVTFFPATVLTI